MAFAGLALDGDPHSYGVVLDRVAHKHASLGVVAPQYDVVYEHLFAAIAEKLGDAITPEIGAAWTELYWLMANELRVPRALMGVPWRRPKGPAPQAQAGRASRTQSAV